jgi:hypothetical protein
MLFRSDLRTHRPAKGSAARSLPSPPCLFLYGEPCWSTSRYTWRVGTRTVCGLAAWGRGGWRRKRANARWLPGNTASEKLARFQPTCPSLVTMRFLLSAALHRQRTPRWRRTVSRPTILRLYQ